MRTSIALSLALVGGLAATAALAQQPAPPPAGAPAPVAGVEAAPPPSPPGGPDRPPPPPLPGAHVKLDRDPNGGVRVDVHCARQDSTKECAAIARQLLADTSAAQSGK